MIAPFEIRWEAPEFEYREKNISWYWTSIIVTTLILGAAIWQKNFLFGLFIILAEILILTWGNRKPRMVAFKINEKGLEIVEGKFYPYAEIEAFSFDESANTDWPLLAILFRQKFKTPLKVSIPKNRVKEILDVLRPQVHEIDPQSSLLDHFEKFFRF
ncbi:MAG: hypothetical protein AAB652_00350 [Patescibacteria group bacterium]